MADHVIVIVISLCHMSYVMFMFTDYAYAEYMFCILYTVMFTEYKSCLHDMSKVVL